MWIIGIRSRLSHVTRNEWLVCVLKLLKYWLYRADWYFCGRQCSPLWSGWWGYRGIGKESIHQGKLLSLVCIGQLELLYTGKKLVDHRHRTNLRYDRTCVNQNTPNNKIRVNIFKIICCDSCDVYLHYGHLCCLRFLRIYKTGSDKERYFLVTSRLVIVKINSKHLWQLLSYQRVKHAVSNVNSLLATSFRLTFWFHWLLSSNRELYDSTISSLDFTSLSFRMAYDVVYLY